MKKVIISRIALVCCLVMVLSTLFASATTYTYSIDGDALVSPDAYTPHKTIDSSAIGLEVPLSSPSDIKTDNDGNVYIADPDNNRIIVLDRYYNFKFEISKFTNMNGIAGDGLKGCQGVFVWEGIETDDTDDGYTNAKYIYVADTDNMRIVIFDENGNYIRHIDKPASDVFEEGEIYKPEAIAVSSSKRIYVVSGQLYQGVMTLNDDGEFCGYIGATKAVYSLFDIIWRNFQTQEQREGTETNVSSPFNNIVIDDDGFLWVTKVPPADETDSATAALRNKTGDYATVKKISTSGDDIMKRNGFFAPMGEVAINVRSSAMSSFGQTTGISDIVSIAMGDEGTYSIIDEKRSKVYTYNEQGDLLFAFGDKPGNNGAQIGEFNKVSSITYQGEDMIVLDAHTNSFTVFRRTDYGKLLMTAIEHNNDRKFSLSIDDWKEVLKRNNNFDAAYIALGDAYYRNGEYEIAMDYYEVAYDTVGYSAAFKLWRKGFVEKNIIWVIIVPVAVLFLIGWLFKTAAKINAKAAISGRRKTFKEEFFYAFHLIFHPFDGFWDLKHEKRGSLRGAFAWLGLAVLAFTYQAVGQAFIFNPRGSMSSVIMQLSSLLVPLILWAAANWCLTTLFNGEGSFKDVFIASCYSLAPIPLIIFITTLLTYCVTDTEATFITLITSVCYVWLGLLLFCSTMVTHDYSLGKNTLTILGTIAGMAIIMFICALFTGLFAKMASFINNIITEIQYRS
ncbi:MAG: hypothetical protein J6M35_08690 [Clostridia bacterium]|nr:hypothetical protein [Clostridia bacterium]